MNSRQELKSCLCKVQNISSEAFLKYAHSRRGKVSLPQDLFHKSTEIMMGRVNWIPRRVNSLCSWRKKVSMFYYFRSYRNYTSNYRGDTIWQVNAIWCVRFGNIILNFITGHYKCKSIKLENRAIVPGMWEILFQA